MCKSMHCSFFLTMILLVFVVFRCCSLLCAWNKRNNVGRKKLMVLAPFSPSWSIPQNYRMLDNVKTSLHIFPTLTTQCCWIQTYTRSSLSSRRKQWRPNTKSNKMNIAPVRVKLQQFGLQKVNQAEGHRLPSLPFHRNKTISQFRSNKNIHPTGFTAAHK